MQQLNPSEISEIIKKQIDSYDKSVDVMETGSVLTVGDGIARVYGLQDVMAGEMVQFPGDIFGMVLNLEEDSVGVAILGEDEVNRGVWTVRDMERSEQVDVPREGVLEHLKEKTNG